MELIYTSMTKQEFNKYITITHKDLLVVCDRVIGLKKGIRNKNELLNQTVLDIMERGVEKFIIKDKDDFIKLMARCIKNVYRWNNNDYNKIYKSDIYLEEIFNELCEDDMNKLFIDSSAELDMEIFSENTNIETKEYIKDLYNSDLPYSVGDKYLKLMILKSKFTMTEKILFHFKYELGLGSRPIADVISSKFNFKVNYQQINKRINALKEKINKEI